MDTKKMRNKFLLAALLLTPIMVVIFSSLYFISGMSPDGTKNNGIFFRSYFDLNDFKNIEGKQDLIKFEEIPSFSAAVEAKLIELLNTLVAA